MEEKGRKISLMPDHTGPLTGAVFPIVDADGINRKADASNLVILQEDGKIDPELLPDGSGSGGDGTGGGIYVVTDL